MESVMNFLADYYIAFFVAAGVLCFALIGFIIESRKKRKNEFKGESIEEGSKTSSTSDTSSTIESTTPADLSAPSVAPVEPETVSLESTMEINDIPINSNTESTSTSEPIEFYSEPVSMPSVSPIDEVSAQNTTPSATSTNTSDVFSSTPTMDQTYTNNVPNNASQTYTGQENINQSVSNGQSNVPPTNIFDDMK